MFVMKVILHLFVFILIYIIAVKGYSDILEAIE